MIKNQAREKKLIYFMAFIFISLVIISLKSTTLNQTKSLKNFGVLLNPQPSKIHLSNDENIEQKVTTTAAAPITEMPLKTAQPLQAPRESLALRIQSINSQSLDDLQRNIEMADLLISKTPEVAFPYKAKLMSLIYAEGKYQVQINDDDIKFLLAQLVHLDETNESILSKETALAENAQNEINTLDKKIEDYEYQREMIELELETSDIDYDRYENLTKARADILTKEDEIMQKSVLLQVSVDNTYFPDESYINEDLAQIPFQRQLAKGEFNDAILNAHLFINEYPNSPIGYFYLIRAYELSNQFAEALEVMQDEHLTDEVRLKLEDKLQQEQGNNPENYWQNIKL